MDLLNRDGSIADFISFSPDGRFLTWGSGSGPLTLIDLPALQKKLDEFERSVTAP